jgi:hypothetical protein
MVNGGDYMPKLQARCHEFLSAGGKALTPAGRPGRPQTLLFVDQGKLGRAGELQTSPRGAETGTSQVSLAGCLGLNGARATGYLDWPERGRAEAGRRTPVFGK